MLIAFREWRRTRPFWGGLLIVCGAAETLSTTVLSLGPTFRVGLGGANAFVGIIITAVLGLCGLLLWFSPGQRTFYSIVAVILALATFNTINYGGFFLGMLLGIVGGAMAFAWSSGPTRSHPQERPAGSHPQERSASSQSGPVVARLVRGWFWRQGQARQAKMQKDQAQGVGAGSRDRLLTIVTAPLAGLFLLAPAVPALRVSSTHQTSGGCILIILCPPSKSPTPSPTPTKTTPTPSHQPSPTPRTAPPVTSQQPSAAQSTPSTPGKTPRGKVKRAATPLGLVAPDVPTTLTAGAARLAGLAYDGVTNVPRPSGGPLPMLKFTLRSLTLTGNPVLTSGQHGSVVTTSASLLSFSGNVVLYVTRLSGDLPGGRVTLTPRSALPLVERLLGPLTQGTANRLTHLVTGQPIIMAAASHWDNFHTTVG